MGVAGTMEGKGDTFRHRQQYPLGSATTSASNGSVNAMHSSFSPVGGVALPATSFSARSSLVAWGPVFMACSSVILTVFIAGLMSVERPNIWAKDSGTR